MNKNYLDSTSFVVQKALLRVIFLQKEWLPKDNWAAREEIIGRGPWTRRSN